ncbi:sigma-70 family RNA polymerase sigma factor [bacterium 3DAC]|jgi:RNA polymerase sigma factor (sigma-70 family)|nr:sigma-70 family RNA polymerase sigma factor [Dictyoglomota bacterium]UZN22556.1 sigma-70 family RNA polymerase sigma factor [bacterium 3DAC]
MVEKAKVEQIIGGLYDELIGFAMKYVGIRADAEDLVQDTLFKIWEYTDKITTLSTLRGLIYRTLRNKIIDFMRKNKYPKVPIDKLTLASEESVDEEEIFDIWKYVDKLPEDEKTVITLRFKEGMSIKEVANAMNRSVAGIKSLQYRAIRRLREMIDNEDKR